MKRIFRSLAHPRFLSGLMVVAYTIVMVFVVFSVIPYLLFEAGYSWGFIPATLILIATPISAISAWNGCYGIEMTALPITALGLIIGIMFDLEKHMNNTSDYFSSLIAFMLGLLTIAVLARYYYIWEARKSEYRTVGRPLDDRWVLRDDRERYYSLISEGREG